MSALSYYSRPDGPQPRMRYWAAFKFVWTSPNGWKNLLLAAVCVLIPIVGVLVLVGYLRDVMLSRLDTLDDDRLGYPDFDFNNFAEYLTRGLWPFLVSLVAGLVMVPVVMVPMIAILVLQALKPGGPVFVVAVVVIVLVVFAVVLLFNVLSVPLVIRAALLEEFGPSFSWGWIKDFTRRTWPEVLLSLLFLMATSVPLILAGEAMCFVGIYPAIALMTIAQWHMHFQVYRIYLSRGGEWVPPKPVYQPPLRGFPVQPNFTPPMAPGQMPPGPPGPA